MQGGENRGVTLRERGSRKKPVDMELQKNSVNYEKKGDRGNAGTSGRWGGKGKKGVQGGRGDREDVQKKRWPEKWSII